MIRFLLICLLAIPAFAQVGLRSPAFVAQLQRTTTSSFTDPSDYTPYAWYQGNTAVTNYADALASDGERVKSWGDVSGNQRHLLGPATDTSSLQFKSAIQNGIGALDSGTSLWLSNNFGATLSQPITVYFTARVTSLGTFAYWMDGIDAVNRLVLGKSNGDKLQGGGATALTVPDSLVNNTTYVVAAVFNGASSAIWTNGVLAISGPVSGEGIAGLHVGNFYTHGSGGGRQCEVIVYGAAHDSTQIGNVTTWLNSKWAAY